MPTTRNSPDTTTARPTSQPPEVAALEADDADESLTADESENLHELSFDDDSRSDRHSAIGSAQSAQNDNAPDDSIDEIDEENDISEQEED
ncbi:MAG: hypothetical protein ABW106_16460 [Steroidobacteraceae bacterium]